MTQVSRPSRVCVTGGAGYVGSLLVPKLLAAGYAVSVLDLYLYGPDVFGDWHRHPELREVRGDIRDPDAVRRAFVGCDAVIHLACISNDPSFELDPKLGKSINLDAFRPMVRTAKRLGVKRFIYASSSSVYGVKDEPEVTEDLSLEPLTDYSRFKAECEKMLTEEREPGFVALTLRPATVCGYARRLRLDLAVNIFASQAYFNRKVTVFGGSQQRPNLNVEDMTDLYLACLGYPDAAIDGKTFNAGYENHSVLELAKLARDVMGEDVELVTQPTDDLRSYRVSSAKIARELGFKPRHTIRDAIASLKRAFDGGLVPDAMTGDVYYNIRTMRSVRLA